MKHGLIDRRDFEEWLIENCTYNMAQIVKDYIREQPIVDAVPVRHGYNKQFEFPSQFTCSVCGWESWDTYCGDTDTFNYCPNCGAKMDGADGERRGDE